MTLDWIHLALYLIGGAYFVATTRVGFGWGREGEEPSVFMTMLPSLLMGAIWPLAVPIWILMHLWRSRGNEEPDDNPRPLSDEELLEKAKRMYDKTLRQMSPKAFKIFGERYEEVRRQRQATNMDAGE